MDDDKMREALASLDVLQFALGSPALFHIENIREALTQQPESEPYAYACKAGCGCMWRDNKNGTMSLYGENSESCSVCEFATLDELEPLYSASQPSAQVPEVPDLREEFEKAAMRAGYGDKLYRSGISGDYADLTLDKAWFIVRRVLESQAAPSIAEKESNDE